MTQSLKKQINEAIDSLKCAVENKDNESAHSSYDAVLYVIASEYESKTIDKIDKIVKDIDFWYA